MSDLGVRQPVRELLHESTGQALAGSLVILLEGGLNEQAKEICHIWETVSQETCCISQTRQAGKESIDIFGSQLVWGGFA